MRTQLLLATSLAALLAAAPLSLTSPDHLSQAYAKNDGGGGGNGGGNASGRDGGSPGNSANAPGHSGTGPGNSGNAPGLLNATPRTDGKLDRNQATTTRDRNPSTQTATTRGTDKSRAEARSKAANELGTVHAAHASATARANASPNSMVGRIATYENQMNAALAIRDPIARNAAITQAREQLALSANKSLTPTAVARVDGLLGIQGAPPELGAVR